MNLKIKKRTRIIILSILALVLILLTEDKINKQQELDVQKTESTSSENLYKVVRIIDGDTIEVTKEGSNEKVRLLGINTPESVDPRRAVECLGKEASKETSNLVLDKNVILEADDSQQNKDKYGRLLRYVYLEDGTIINEQLIKTGFAYEYTYNSPYKLQKLFKEAENFAKQNGVGLWNSNICPQTK